MDPRLTAVALVLAACTPAPGASGPASAPRIEACRVQVAAGTVRVTASYRSAHPPSERVLLIAAFQRPGGEELLRVLARRSERTIRVAASGRELVAGEGWSYAPGEEGGELTVAIPERAAGVYDLAGAAGRVHVVGQIERGEGAIGLGAVDSDPAVF